MSAKFKGLILFCAIFLASCASWGTATTVPEIYLTQSDITMELKKEAFAVTATAVSLDGKYLMTGDNGGSTGGDVTPWLRLWDLIEMKQVLNLRDLSGTINAIDISPDGRYAITGGTAFPGPPDSPKYPLSIWDLSTGKLFKTFEALRPPPNHQCEFFSGW